MTSSPFFIFKDSKASCKAAVPLETEIAYFFFSLLAKFLSNFFTNGPEEDIKPSLKHLSTYFFSLPISRGFHILYINHTLISNNSN